MHKYTKNIRAMPTSCELMPLLADHLTTWFDSQVNDSAMHDLAHKCNVLFLDLDMAQEKKIDRNLVMEALAQFTEETMVREAITEEADEDEDEDYLRRQSQVRTRASSSPVTIHPPLSLRLFGMEHDLAADDVSSRSSCLLPAAVLSVEPVP